MSTNKKAGELIKSTRGQNIRKESGMGILILIIIILILCIGKGSSGYDNSGEYCCPYCGRCYNNEDDYLDCISRDEYDIDEGIW